MVPFRWDSRSGQVEQLGVVIVGSTGVIGQTHIDAIKEIDNCRLVGVTARRQELVRQQASDLKVLHYASLDEVLEDPDVDALIIATPHPSHLDITLRAFQAGKHVLVEKPMAVTPSEADAMVAAARRSGRKLGVLFNNRFRADVIKMRELLLDGTIGEIYHASLVTAMFRTQDYYDRLEWRGTWAQEGGGVLINQGIHHLDLFQWLVGMPRSVISVNKTYKHKIEVEDYVSAIFQYDSGMAATVHCNTVQAPGRQRLEIWGERAGVVLDGRNLTVHRLETPVQQFIDTDRTFEFVSPNAAVEAMSFEPFGGTHAPAIEDFARAVIEGRDPFVTGEDGQRSQELIAAMTLASYKGERVDLPVDRDEYDRMLEDLKYRRQLPS